MNSALPIETEGLTKLYGRDRGIEDVTFAVAAGEVFGFLGPNGAGKTTTIRTLLDLIHPSRGSARLFGLDSRRESVAIRARLGNLPGDFGYGRQSSGREALALLAKLRGVDGFGRAEELARRFHADLDRPLGQLSRGNRQKIGLILATFHEPELLILDEPTSGLDPLMQQEFLGLISEERERGCSVFISSHELDEVQRVCDRVGIVREGRLIAVERMVDLLGKARRRVTVRLADADGLESLRGLPGVGDLRIADGEATFTVAGEIDPVVKALASHHILDLEAVHPSLEEVFLTYYTEPEGDERSAPRTGCGHLSDRRRSVLAWGLPVGLMSAFIVAIFPSVEDSISKVVNKYPSGLKEAFGIGQLSNVEQYLHAEMLSLIVPLALGYLAVRAVASGLSGAAESGRLDVLLSAPVSRRRICAAGFLATGVELAAVLAVSWTLTMLGSVLSGAGLAAGPAAAGFASVWPLGLLFAGLGIVVCGWTLRTTIVTGAVAGVLVSMYVIDLIGRLDDDLSGVRYLSVFKYYGNAIEDGIEPLAFCGVAAAAAVLAALGACFFDRRDLSG